jgi:hypothetical protein
LRGRALLSDEVGLGKTIEALMVLLEYRVRGMAHRVLVLAPPALVPQWVGELAEKAMIAARTTEREGDAVWRGDGVVVASLATARMQRNVAAVQAEPWDLVIVDEAHRVKRRGSSSWKLVDGLRSRFLLLLTATPIETELEELYQLVTLLKPGQFDTPAAFRRRFVDPASPTSPKNREALRELLGEVMVRNTRASCGLKLPPRYVSTVVVDPEDGERALYAAAMAVAANDAILKQSINFYTNQSRPSGILSTDATLSKPKADELRQLWNEMSKGLNVGGVPIVSSGLKFQPITISNRDTQTAEALKLSEAAVAQVFRVPLAIVGSEQQPMGSTEALMNFWIAGGLGFALDRVELAFDKLFGLPSTEYSELDSSVLLRSNLKDKVEAFARSTIAGIHAPNEARAEFELPAVKFGDEPRTQAQVVPLSAAQGIPSAPAAPASPASPAAPVSEPGKVFTMPVKRSEGDIIRSRAAALM